MLKYMLGNVRHQLDEKNRMRIPAKYREALGDPCYIVQGRKVGDKMSCFYVIPHERFASLIEKVDTDKFYGGDDAIDTATALLGSGDELSEDPQGRVKLNKEICDAAGITKDIVFVGKGTYLEIWAAEVWDKRFSVLNPDNLDKMLEQLKKHGV